jgi:hypothetical protein
MFNLILPSLFLAAVLPASPTPTSSQHQTASNTLNDPIAIQTEIPDRSSPVCLKMRVYQFERNDGEAPRLMRETTCTTVRPFAKKAKMPRARVIPAD